MDHPNKWTPMDEVFSSITFYADQSNKTKIYTKPEYEGESTIQVSKVHTRQGFHQGHPKGQSYPRKGRYQKQDHNKYLGSSQIQQQVGRHQHDKLHKHDDHKNNKDGGYLKCYHWEVHIIFLSAFDKEDDQHHSSQRKRSMSYARPWNTHTQNDCGKM